MLGKSKILFTTRLSADREKKNLLFLRLIKQRKSTSRTEISKLTDINIVTVSNYINSYLKKGLVVERGYDVSSGGRRPELLELNKRWGYVIGIDIGENYIKGALLDLDMDVLASDSVDNYDKENPRAFINNMIGNLLTSSEMQKDELRKIGIGVSAVSDGMENIVKAKETIEKEMGIPVLVGNAALCAACGEKNLNPDALEAGKVLYIYGDLGKGVFIAGNEFYEASDEESSYSYLKPWHKGPALVTDAVMEAASRNEEEAVDLVRTTGVNLGVRAAYLANLFEPDSVIIGGGIEEAGSLFLDSLRMSVDRFLAQRIKNKMKIAPAVLGRDACVKGASFLAIREALIEA